MLGKLLELLVGAKAGAATGVLLLAGALVGVTSANGVTTIVLDEATPTPTASASPSASPTPTPTAAPSGSPTPSPSASASPTPSPDVSGEPASCAAADAQASADARQRVQSAFSTYHVALEQLRSGAHGRLSDALRKADAMLRAIDRKADETIRELACPETAASPASGTALDQMNEVADRAVAAMQTVYNAAQALASGATPSPLPDFFRRDGHEREREREHERSGRHGERSHGEDESGDGD